MWNLKDRPDAACMEAAERERADGDAGAQLAKHRGDLEESACDLRADLGRHEDDREAHDEFSYVLERFVHSLRLLNGGTNALRPRRVD